MPFVKNLRRHLGERITTVREARKVSIKDLEKMTGLSRGEIKSIENGKKHLELDSLIRIAIALNCRPRITIQMNRKVQRRRL